MPNVKAAIESTDDKITVIHKEKWLRLTRNHAILTWMRENGSMGILELTKSGTLRGDNGEEAMDLAAEQWARDLMLIRRSLIRRNLTRLNRRSRKPIRCT